MDDKKMKPPSTAFEPPLYRHKERRHGIAPCRRSLSRPAAAAVCTYMSKKSPKDRGPYRKLSWRFSPRYVIFDIWMIYGKGPGAGGPPCGR